MTLQVLIIFLDEVQQLHRGLDGGFRLVGIQAARTIYLPVPVPRNDGLYQSIRPTTRRNTHTVIGQPRELPRKAVLINMAGCGPRCEELA